MSSLNFSRLFALVATAAACTLSAVETSHAAIIDSHEMVVDLGAYNPTDPVPTNVFSGGFVSSTDLLNGLVPTSTDISSVEGAGTAPVLTNGTWDALCCSGANNSTEFTLVHSNRFAEYALGSATDIGEIVIYGGWFDRNRDQQNVSVSYSTNNGGSYTALHTINYSGNDNPGIILHRTAISDDSSSTLVAGVTNLRFDWGVQEFGYTGYGEIDVFEAGAVPEPSTFALAGLGLLGLAGYSLRRHRR